MSAEESRAGPKGELETLAAPVDVRKLPPNYETVSLGDIEGELPPDPRDTAADTQTLPDAEPPSEVGRAARVVRRTTRRVADARLAGGDLLEGPQRIDRYELRDVLGEGGCGTVYSAWDPRHEREVALKLMFRGDARAQQRFARELRAIARLRHPHIVPLHDSGEHEGRPYLVMERVQGCSLAEALDEEREDPLDLKTRVEIVRDVCRAIAHAHAKGVLHRDLKPQNVLIDQHGEALVVDFGLARSVDDGTMTRTGAPLGTPAYMPPEQAGAFGGEVSERSDVYALGATLFHALTGRPPYLGRGEELLFLVLNDTPPPTPSQVDLDLPPELDAVVLRCLEKDPARRYGGALELAAELERWLRGEPVLARRVGRAERFSRWVGHNPLVAGLTAGIVLCLAVILLLALQNWRLVRRLGGS